MITITAVSTAPIATTVCDAVGFGLALEDTGLLG